jgi:hypothetical protein
VYTAGGFCRKRSDPRYLNRLDITEYPERKCRNSLIYTRYKQQAYKKDSFAGCMIPGGVATPGSLE